MKSRKERGEDWENYLELCLKRYKVGFVLEEIVWEGDKLSVKKQSKLGSVRSRGKFRNQRLSTCPPNVQIGLNSDRQGPSLHTASGLVWSHFPAFG